MPLFMQKGGKMKKSLQFSLNRQDLTEWSKNALIFLIPTLLVLAGSIVEIVPQEWKYSAIVLYVLNRVTALLKLYVQGPK